MSEKKKLEYIIEDIDVIEQLEDFDDEYVYDIEVDDTHTFFANDILVHNSIYVEMGRVCRWCKIPAERQTQFVVDLWNYSLGPYMENKYEEYAKKFNCPKNIQKLELEKIADTTLLFAKKRYAMAECWKEPGIFLKPMDKVIYKGLEIVKGTTPSYARSCMEDFVKYVLAWYQTNETPIPYGDLIEKLRGYKKIFMNKKGTPEEIANGCNIGDYDKFILKDKGSLVVGEHCPAHVRAAGVANLMLNDPKNKKYKARYNFIRTGDKVKWYYTTDKTYEVFAFLPGEFPGEYALEMDMDVQFEKTILSFCNKILQILGYQTLTASLCYSASLF